MVSFSDLDDSLNAVTSLITLESGYADPPLADDRQTAFALRGACVVLTTAAFESFLRSLFEEQLQKIKAQHVPLVHFPEKLRVEAVYASLDLAMRGDHSTRGLEKAGRLGDVATAARLVASDSFWPRALADTQSNPDSSCVKRMFRSVGRPRVFEEIQEDFQSLWGGPVALMYVETRLDALVASRNQVAHTADAAHVTRSELSENTRFVTCLASALYADLRRHVDSLILGARAGYFEQAEQSL